jgi:diaminopimelate epimerase
MAEQSSKSIMIDTVGGLLQVQRVGRGLVSVDMGRAKTEWEEIPLVSRFDTQHLVVGQGELRDAACVNMGNPHAVYFVGNVDKIDLANLGPKIEKNKMFPEGANVSIVAVESREAIKIRVWERGVGLTLACGSAACAAVVAAHMRGLTERKVTVTLRGGTLDIDYGESGNVLMTGKVATVYVGTFDLDLLTMGAT